MYNKGVLMQKGILIICLILFFNGCAGLTAGDRDFPTKVTTRHPSFSIHKANGVKFSMLPVRDFSDHYGVDYPIIVMDTFINEVNRRNPELDIIKPEAAAGLVEGAGKGAEYQVFANNCNNNVKYCPQKGELVALFKNSGIRYIIALNIGGFDIPVPGVSMVYSVSVTVYDIDYGGEVVYQATCDGSVYSDYLEGGAAAYTNSVMEEATKAIVAKMYAAGN